MRVCTAIANEVAEPSGFVPLRSLLARFGARLVVRPLLVEGMLARVSDDPSAGPATAWAVLVDRDTYSVDDESVARESAERPLPVRLRFTVAHELAHSVAFRPTEFGINLPRAAGPGQSTADFVRSIERETDRLSSLLLWPERAVEGLLAESGTPLSVERLAQVVRDQGISRYAVLNRLCTFQRNDSRGLLQRVANRNIGLGLGEWVTAGTAILKKWPTIVMFDRNIVPDLFLRLQHDDRVPAASLFDDPKFLLCGGTSSTTEFTTKAGLQNVPDAERMRVQVAVEKGSKNVGATFFFSVCRKAEPPSAAASGPQESLPLHDARQGVSRQRS